MSVGVTGVSANCGTWPRRCLNSHWGAANRIQLILVIPKHMLWITFVNTSCDIALNWDPFYKHGLILIPAWICNHIHYKVWDWITYPFPNFNLAQCITSPKSLTQTAPSCIDDSWRSIIWACGKHLPLQQRSWSDLMSISSAMHIMHLSVD